MEYCGNGGPSGGPPQSIGDHSGAGLGARGGGGGDGLGRAAHGTDGLGSDDEQAPLREQVVRCAVACERTLGCIAEQLSENTRSRFVQQCIVECVFDSDDLDVDCLLSSSCLEITKCF